MPQHPHHTCGVWMSVNIDVWKQHRRLLLIGSYPLKYVLPLVVTPLFWKEQQPQPVYIYEP